MAQRVRIQATVTYEVQDEMELREAATTETGELNVMSGDAIMRLLAVRRQMWALPGTSHSIQMHLEDLPG